MKQYIAPFIIAGIFLMPFGAHAATPGLGIDEQGLVSVFEGGSIPDVYTVALTTAPTADVVVTLTASLSQLVVTPLTLKFTPQNWNALQNITVEAFDDLVYEQAHSAVITHDTSSTDTNYDKKSALVTVLITDNDAYGNNGGRDTQAPNVPAAITGVGDGKTITLTWTDPVAPDLRYIEVLRNSGGATPVDGVPYSPVAKGEQKFIDTAVTVGQTYVYQLRSLDWSGNVRLSEEFSVKVATPIAPAPTPVPTPAPTPIPTPVITAPTPIDAMDQPLMLSDAKEFGLTLSDAQATAAVNFYVLGTVGGDTPQYAVKLGAGERRALLRDYWDTTGRTDILWDDMARLAGGIKPVGRNLAKEQAQVTTALAMWLKVKGRAPNFKNASEDLAWNTLMYRIRFTRDISKEQVGIVRFKAVFKRIPVSPMDWAMVRVLSYVL